MLIHGPKKKFWTPGTGIAPYYGAGGGGGAPGSTTTWNPADKATTITLSGGNLIATGNSSTDGIAHATTSENTGKYYFEITVVGASGNQGVGLAKGGNPVNTFLGASSNEFGYYGSGLANGLISSLNPMPTYTAGDVICFAWDAFAQTVWLRANGGNWNKSGAANPATNVGGTSISIAGNPGVFPAVSIKTSADIISVNFGQSAFSFTPPSGFSALP